MPRAYRSSRIAAAAIFLILCGAAAPVRTQEGPAVAAGLTLEQAVEAALSRHPDVLTAQQEVRAAAARRLQAEARPDPSLSFGTDGIPFNLKGEGTEINLGLEKTFEFPGKRSLRTEIGRQGEELAALELERVRLLLAARVKRAYLRTVLAQRIAADLERSVAQLDQLIDAVRIRFEAGQSTYADILRARVEKIRLQNRIIEARRDRTAGEIELAHLLVLPEGPPPLLSTPLRFVPLDRTASQVVAAALRSRPSLKIAALRATRAESEVKLSGLNRSPDLTAGLFVPSKTFRNWGFSLGLTLPLSRMRWDGQRNEAEAGREASRISAEAASRRVRARVSAAFAELKSAEDQVRVFETRLLAEIEDELKISLEYYRYGKMEAFALLDLYRSLTEARLEYGRALYLCAVDRTDLEVAGEDGE
jgi:cobalt-zinc-cadmium efflux system outer membrane protein